MKFKAKIFISFLFLTTLGIILSATILYIKMNALVLSLIEDQIRAVADTTTVFMDVGLVRKVIREKASNKADYYRLKGMLVKATQQNRLDSTVIPFRNIFIVIPSEDSGHVVLVADGYKDPSISYPFGKEERVSDEFLAHLDEIYIVPNEQGNQLGNWYVGYAPIRTQDGMYVATLVIEVDAKVIQNEFLQSLSYLIAAGMLAILIALIAAGIISHLMGRSLEIIEDGVKQIEKGNYTAKIELETEDEFEHLGHSINHMVQGLTERDRLKMGFSRYVSEFVLNKVLNTDAHFLEGERKKITVLFSDIRDFTRLAEKLPAEQVVRILNEYFDVMIDVIFKHRGTLDKFMGDGMMVIFGAPLDDPSQENNAVKAAIAMQKALVEINIRVKKYGVDGLKIGIGIHTGLAVVGNIGSEKRMEYTAIGDTVNIASRVEQLTKTYEDNIIVSEETALPIKEAFPFENFGSVQLKGKSKEIVIYGIPHSAIDA